MNEAREDIDEDYAYDECERSEEDAVEPDYSDEDEDQGDINDRVYYELAGAKDVDEDGLVDGLVDCEFDDKTMEPIDHMNRHSRFAILQVLQTILTLAMLPYRIAKS
jgi:hypothetical protein